MLALQLARNVEVAEKAIAAGPMMQARAGETFFPNAGGLC
jgi:hypothetical protein